MAVHTARRPYRRVPTLTTLRLVLRAPHAFDCAVLARVANDLQIARWLGRLPHPYRLADARHFVETIAPAEATWAITKRDDGALLGMVGVHREGLRAPLELGYWLGRRHARQGYATEAARAVVDHVRATAPGKRLTAAHYAGNRASARVLGKLGFRRVGTRAVPVRALGIVVTRVELVADRR